MDFCIGIKYAVKMNVVKRIRTEDDWLFMDLLLVETNLPEKYYREVKEKLRISRLLPGNENDLKKVIGFIGN